MAATKEDIEKRRQSAIFLRLQGGSYDDIAETLRAEGLAGERYDARAAIDDVRKVLEKTRSQSFEETHEMRMINLMRIDRMIAALMEYALKGDIVAINHVMKLMDHQAKLVQIHVPPPKQSMEIESVGSSSGDAGTLLGIREVIVTLNRDPPPVLGQDG